MKEIELELTTTTLDNNIGATYSSSVYEKYQETGDHNLFEETIDQIMLEEYSDDQETIDYIKSLGLRDKRMAILSLLDNDHGLWNKIVELIKGNKISYVNHIKEVVKLQREYVKVAKVDKKKFGEVMTPFELVRDMLTTLPKEVWKNPNLKFLDPSNGVGPFPVMVIMKLMKELSDWEPDSDKRYKHIVENMIYVCELQPKNMFQYMCSVDPQDTFKLNIHTGSFLEEGFDYHMKNVWGVEKFDIILGNPPYNQTIDLKFLNKSYGISDKILMVHPSTWLIDEKNKQKKFIKSKELVGDHLVSIRLFNGNGVFGISLFVPCVITYIDKDHTGKIKLSDEINNIEVEYDNIFDINKYNTEEYLSLKKKFENIENIDQEKIFNISTKRNSTSGKIKKYKHLNTEGEYYINIAQIRGNVNLKSDIMLQDDFYTIVTRDNIISNEISNHMFWKFNEEKMAKNFLNYIKSKIPRFLLSVYKNNSQLECGEMALIPWLDFTQEWDDVKLKKEFNITDKEWKFIDSVIPDYY